MVNSCLILPGRDQKPRKEGLSYIIDGGLSVGQLEDVLDVADQYIDMVKFGWGTGLVVQGLERKIELLHKAGIDYYFGGTLFEIAFSQGRLEQFCDWVDSHGARFFEISDGSISLDLDVKIKLIERLSSKFNVLVEVGSKDAAIVTPPSQWIKEINCYLELGVYKVIAEGRTSGQAGIYRQSGEIRMGLIQEILSSGILASDLIFEAPKKEHQAWFVKNIGNDVNLGNISPNDVINLETFRLGLRSEVIDI